MGEEILENDTVSVANSVVVPVIGLTVAGAFVIFRTDNTTPKVELVK